MAMNPLNMTVNSQAAPDKPLHRPDLVTRSFGDELLRARFVASHPQSEDFLRGSHRNRFRCEYGVDAGRVLASDFEQ
jgi:hypothetical protein